MPLDYYGYEIFTRRWGGGVGGRFSSLFFLNGQMSGLNVVTRHERKRVYARKGNAGIFYEEWVKQKPMGVRRH